MHTHHDAKAMSKILKDECERRGLKLNHSDSLEIVAKQFGLKNWNVLAALIGDTGASAEVSGKAAPLELPELVVPTGWLRGGREPRLYEIGVPIGGGLMTIRRHPRADNSGSNPGGSFGTLFQIIAAEPFAGRTVRLSADVSTMVVDGTAAIWVRMDDREGRMVAFDDLQRQLIDRTLTGTVGWTGQEVTLKVPSTAHSIHFGLYLSGYGTAYARNMVLAATDSDPAASELPAGPANMQLHVA
jgi:Glyoxalase superfamily protein